MNSRVSLLTRSQLVQLFLCELSAQEVAVCIGMARNYRVGGETFTPGELANRLERGFKRNPAFRILRQTISQESDPITATVRFQDHDWDSPDQKVEFHFQDNKISVIAFKGMAFWKYIYEEDDEVDD